MFFYMKTILTNSRACSSIQSFRTFNKLRLHGLSFAKAQFNPRVKGEPKQLRRNTVVRDEKIFNNYSFGSSSVGIFDVSCCYIKPILSHRPLLVLCCICHRSQWQQTARTGRLWYPPYSRWTWCGKCSWKSFLRGCVVVLWYTSERHNGRERMYVDSIRFFNSIIFYYIIFVL